MAVCPSEMPRRNGVAKKNHLRIFAIQRACARVRIVCAEVAFFDAGLDKPIATDRIFARRSARGRIGVFFSFVAFFDAGLQAAITAIGQIAP